MFKYAFKNLTRKKSRTALSLIGLAVAIAGLIGLISISAGIRYEFNSALSSLQGVTVLAEGAADDTFSVLPASYANDIAAISGVRGLTPFISVVVSNVDGVSALSSGGMSFSGVYGVVGIDPAMSSDLSNPLIYPVEMVNGRVLRATDKNGLLLSKTIADDLGKTVGSRIKLNDKSFTVVGIFEASSEFVGGMLMFAHIDTARELAGKSNDVVSAFYVEATNPKEVDKLARRINFKLDDVEAKSASELAEDAGSILSQIDIFFVLISMLAIIVGAVGILNTMLMSVMDRLKEFGILRAMGWTTDNLLKLVFYESLFIGLIGGVLGCIGGSLLSLLGGNVLPFAPQVSIELLLVGMAAGAVLGVLGGLYPAWRASKLDPVEVIRKEV